MNKLTWDEWYSSRQHLADLHGESVADADAWREPIGAEAAA